MATTPPQGNPKWTWDEEVLAFELYLEVGMVNDEHPSVIALSQYLRSLPLHPPSTRAPSFRNPNGVARKLADIGTRDPRFPERNKTSGSKLDHEIWKHFGADLAEVSVAAREIRNVAQPDPEFT